MFLHTPTFKKLLKASWKNGGITVGRLDSRSLFVAGDYWVTWFDYTSIPNRIRAGKYLKPRLMSPISMRCLLKNIMTFTKAGSRRKTH